MIENISAVIITKNAAETIKVTLDSLAGFKEVVVFDSGSTDNTIDIVQTYKNVSLFQGEFLGFGPTKNYAINLARNDWIFSIDADESLSKKLALHLSEINLESRLIGEIRRDNYFMGKEMRVAGWGRDRLIRLFNRTEYRFSDRQVHEKVEVDSSAIMVSLSGSIKHNSIDNLSQTLEKANLYSELYAEESNTYYPLWVILFKSLYSFIRTYILQRGFLAGWRGLVLSYSNSVGVFYKYIKVYARQKQRSKRMKVGLIISTYNWKEALNQVLESIKLQTYLPDEIVVCDDGSREDSVELVKKHQESFPSILKYVWQEDNGFRAAASRNNGINELSGDVEYIIIIDGDMILHPKFIEDHIRFADKRRFVQGSRVLISEEKTTQILSGGEINSIFNFFSKGISKRKNTIHLRFFSSLLVRPNNQLKGIRSCNMGFWKKDLYAVNGFNEEFEGWGREDTELAVRLFNKGLMRKNIKFSAIAYHLYHKEKSKLTVSINDKHLSQTVSSKMSWCNKGLIKSENYES